MLDHMILTVSDVERSLAFYEAALKPLNIKFFMLLNKAGEARSSGYSLGLREGERASFPIGPQVGKMVKWGGTPTLVQLQVQYYSVSPTVGGPKWNVQLQVTPTLKAPSRKPLL